MIIGFTRKTSKILPKIFCRRFRHCAVITETTEQGHVMHQVGKGAPKLIYLQKRDLKILELHGWVFVEIKAADSGPAAHIAGSRTCVGYAKRALGIRAPFIWTPDQLHRYVAKRNMQACPRRKSYFIE
jgi:hypothetical protein